MVTDERRSFVRGNLDFKLQYKIMTPEEHQNLKQFDKAIFSPFQQIQRTDFADTDAGDASMVNASIINYLVQMDEKLDLILRLISKEQNVSAPFRQGVGQNISGSGMQMITETPAQAGQIIHAKFLLSKYPFVYLDLFGEVIRVQTFNKDAKTLYQVGIEFLDLDINDRDKIIASVFQKQREAIRKSKDQTYEPNAGDRISKTEQQS